MVSESIRKTDLDRELRVSDVEPISVPRSQTYLSMFAQVHNLAGM